MINYLREGGLEKQGIAKNESMYVLPYGQMSLWGATVITNLLSAIPIFGQDIVELIWGGFSVSNATLNRFFSLHYLLPFLLAALAVAHLIAQL